MSASEAARVSEGTVIEFLRRAESYLRQKGLKQARLDAELLLARALDADRLALYLRFDWRLTAVQVDLYRELIRRRVAGEPTAYITGKREFWSLAFEVDSSVLVPRPETELLVETALDLARAAGADPARFLDLGTGCGNVAIALAKECPLVTVIAVDISDAALRVASRNAASLGVRDRLQLIQGDWTSCILSRPAITLVVANPPYIPTGELDQLPAEVRSEPCLALDGGWDGLDFLRMLAAAAPLMITRGGWVVAEVGQGQAGRVMALWRQAGLADVSVYRDLAGIERVVAGKVG